MTKYNENSSKNSFLDKWILLKTDEIINLKETLFSGQVFNFYETDVCEYTGSIYFFVVSFKEQDNTIFYKILHSKIQDINLIEKYLERFFTLQINYNFLADKYKLGLRLITNSLIPTIFSFICSANNNVKRIQKMVSFLYTKGEFAVTYKGFDFYYFPELIALVNIKDELVKNGFGYRSAYICKTSELLLHNDEFSSIREYDNEVLECLKKDNNILELFDRNKVSTLLLKLSGIGPKVRDCILLMGLGLFDVVPIDTHIFKFAKKLIDFKGNTLTDRIYKEIQKKFIEIYGLYAGLHQLFIFKYYLDKNKTL